MRAIAALLWNLQSAARPGRSGSLDDDVLSIFGGPRGDDYRGGKQRTKNSGNACGYVDDSGNTAAACDIHNLVCLSLFRPGAGGDHFRARYWTMPLVNQGAFRYSSNAMYSFALLILWTIAPWFQSRAALAMAIFQHAYIWVHFYCTEAPDLDVLYGEATDAGASIASI